MKLSAILVASLVVLLSACGGGGDSGSTTSPSASASRDEPSVTSAGPSLPAILDPQELFIQPADGGDPRLINSASANFVGMAWSPADDRLAFALSDGSGSEIYLTDPEGNVTKAGTVENVVSQLAWSPDGENVAVLSMQNIPNNNNYVHTVSLLRVDSGGLRELYTEQVPIGIADLTLANWLSDSSGILAIRGDSLVVIDRDTGDVSALASSLGERLDRAEISPDGTQIAVLAFRPNECVDSDVLLLIQIADGKVEEPIPGTCGVANAVYSPSGESIAYSLSPFLPGVDKGAFVLDLATGQSRRITPPQGVGVDVPYWMPDGSALAIRRCYEGCGNVTLVSAAGGDETSLVEFDDITGFMGAFGGFAPGGSRYLYSSDAVSIATIGGQPRDLVTADPDTAYSDLAWSSTGKYVSYVRTQSTVTRQYGVDVTTGAVSRPPYPATGTPSPDGSLTAFLRATDASGTGRNQLLVANLDGSNERALIDETVDTFAWAPDSRRIAYISPLPDMIGDVFASVDLASTEVRRFDVPDGNYFGVLWAPDGGRVAAFLRSGEGLVVVDVAAGQGSVVVPNVDGLSSVSWSPDSRRIAYTAGYTAVAGRQPSPVRVFEIATGVTTTLTSGVGTESLPAWSPDGSDVAFVRELRGTSDPDGPITGVFSVSVESGEESEVARFEGVTYFELQLSWSHSGERLAILVPSSGKARIFSVGSDGSDQILIATGGFREYTKLGWTEDDKQIVVTSAYTGI